MDAVDMARGVAMEASEAARDGQNSYLLAAEALINGLIGGDLLVWNGIDTRTGELMLAGSASADWRWLLPVLGATIEDNPLARYFLGCAGLPAPTRMSDLVDQRTLRNGRLYAELWKPMGTEYQLGFPTSGLLSGVSRGWAINRASSEFSDKQRDILAALQPALAAIEDVVEMVDAEAALPESSPTSTRTETTAQVTYNLTRREREVLDLLARGWTARHIGHHLRISTGTVRKHLERIYAKLGAHDRLSAVLAVRPRVEMRED